MSKQATKVEQAPEWLVRQTEASRRRPAPTLRKVRAQFRASRETEDEIRRSKLKNASE